MSKKKIKFEGELIEAEKSLESSKQAIEFLIENSRFSSLEEVISDQFFNLSEDLQQLKTFKERKMIKARYETRISQLEELLKNSTPNFNAESNFEKLRSELHEFDQKLTELRNLMQKSYSEFR